MENSARKPEEYIKDFLEVLEKQSELFPDEAIEGLVTLNDIAKLEDKSNQEVAKAIRDWCQSYPDIYDALIGGVRKPKPEPVQPDKQEGMLKNRWPDLFENLEKRKD